MDALVDLWRKRLPSLDVVYLPLGIGHPINSIMVPVFMGKLSSQHTMIASVFTP